MYKISYPILSKRYAEVRKVRDDLRYENNYLIRENNRLQNEIESLNWKIQKLKNIKMEYDILLHRILIEKGNIE